MASPKKSSKSKDKREELPPQPDPHAALDSAAFLAAAQPVLARLEADLNARGMASPAVAAALTARYDAEKQAERTADSFEGWSAALATQVAAAWLLSCVFVRTLEDRGLLKQARLAGPGAEDSQRQFFQFAPSLTERDYLLTVFRELGRHPAARDLFDAEHSLVWKLSPSAETAKELLELFRSPNANEPAFRFGQASTRFLGDLYQDLSEDVRKRFALLQTPDFVEAFILDRTLEPAVARFGLNDTTLIDPTCGSGHFLLGAFDRLYEHRLRAYPGIDSRVAAVQALDGIYGADVNAYAVAITRFRLTISFLEKAGYGKLADAPSVPLHLVCADTLRINPQHPQQELWQRAGSTAGAWIGDVFAFDDERAAIEVLGREYSAVVGNPPYITVKDAALREVYRAMYPQSAAGKYSLSAPFCERFFQLSRPRGYVGQITANSFMKREFGKKLIESFLPTVNLELIVNTAGAFIPGHGTPTILLFGSREPPQGASVLAVLASRGEPSTPADPARGEVWTSIVNHHNDVGFENDYVSVVRMSRETLHSHPWSLGGGQAAEVKEMLESRGKKTLGEVADAIGFDAIMGEETLFTGSPDWFRRLGLAARHVRFLCEGECLRDWTADTRELAIFPYSEELLPDLPDESVQLRNHFWRYRSLLEQRSQFGKTTIEAGLKWFEYRSFYKSKRSTPLSIAFSAVASHNHFVLDRGGRVFKQSAPLVKLHPQASEDDYLALLAYLNSSTAGFYMRQVSHQKQMMGGDSIRHTDPTTVTFDFSGGSIAALPLPPWTEAQRQKFVDVARTMERLANELSSLQPAELTKRDTITRSELDAAGLESNRIRNEMVGVQEWLDWFTYEVFGLHEHADAVGIPSAARPGLRAFEVIQHRSGVSGTSVTVDGHEIGSEQEATELDRAVPSRISCIKQNSNIKELEQPQFKRRWIGRQGKFNKKESTFAADVIAGVEGRLLDICETCMADPKTLNARELAERCSAAVSSVPWLVEEMGANLKSTLQDLLERTAVPFLDAMTFSDSGLALLREWERVWELQRRQDAGERIQIGVPDTFEPRDYRRSQWQAHRGKRNVPTERFISYPQCESDQDGELVFGWGGWDSLQRAQALASLYLARKDGEGWNATRLMPMLAGLLELIPWVKQWHNEPSAEFNGLRMGAYFEQFLDGECRHHGLTHDDLRAWRPERTRSKGKAKKEAKAPTSQKDPDAQTRKPGKVRAKQERDDVQESFTVTETE